jgi:hypothetical protein
MFAVGFPIAPLFCLVNNMIERKTDGLKTIKMRRPRYMGSHGLGSWLYVLEFLTVVSVVTNMLIMYFSSKVLRAALDSRMSRVDVLLLTVFIEHALFALKLGISISVLDTPRWVERARARLALALRGETEATHHTKKKGARSPRAASTRRGATMGVRGALRPLSLSHLLCAPHAAPPPLLIPPPPAPTELRERMLEEDGVASDGDDDDSDGEH